MRKKLPVLCVLFSSACAQLNAGDVLNPNLDPPTQVIVKLGTESQRARFMRARELDRSGDDFHASRQYQLLLIDNPNLDFVRFRKAYIDAQRGNFLSAQSQLARLKEIGYPISLTGAVRELQSFLNENR